MFNATTELFLHNYFLFSRIAGKLVGDDRKLFDKLYEIFLLPPHDKDELFALVGREEVREIISYADYAQACRIRKYSELSDYESKVTDEVWEAIAVKGNALRDAKLLGFDDYADTTETAVCKALSDSANNGAVGALCALGYLQCEGIFVARNVGMGIKNLERAARWNSLGGMLLSLRYSEKTRRTNLGRLYTVTRGTLNEEVYATATLAYGYCEKRVLPENKMLQKAFGAGILKPELYTSQYSRFIFSEILSAKDKERTLFSGHKEAISETADLPLKLRFGEISFDPQAIEELPLVREKEQDGICTCAFNSDMRGESTYRPLCVCGDSDYLLGLYISAMSDALRGAHIERIDVADLGDYDLEPTKNNVFVRSCDEDKQNVYFLCLKGNIREGVLGAVRNFLQTDKRRKFRLQHPGAVIDLGAVLPICFCDKQNARHLRPYCDVVTLAPVCDGEKTDLLVYVLRSKAAQYRMNSVTADDAAMKRLVSYSVDSAEKIIDRVVRFNRMAGSLTITAEMLEEVAAGDAGQNVKYGFGGAVNENR